MTRPVKKALIVSAALAAASFALLLAVRLFPALSTAAKAFSASFSGLLGALFSLAPLHLGELLFFALFPVLIALFVMACVRRRVALFFSRLLAAALGFLLFFNAVWGVFYFVPPLSEEHSFSEQQLSATAESYFRMASELAPQMPRDEQGHLSSPDMKELAVQSASLLSASPLSRGKQISPPKGLLSSPLFTAQGITGIYDPFTGECAVNTQTPATDLPFVCLHELFHRLGTAREDEANFLAILAAVSSEDPAFRYSGALMGALYCWSGLPSQTRTDLLASASPELLQDIKDRSAALEAFSGPAAAAHDAANDLYLRLYGDPSGVRSYGEVTDLLIAYRLGLFDPLA